jgi:hypothetical protein
MATSGTGGSLIPGFAVAHPGYDMGEFIAERIAASNHRSK